MFRMPMEGFVMLNRIVLLASLLAAGCSAVLAPEEARLDDPVQDAVVLQPETVLLDQAPGVQSLEVGTDQIVVWTDGTASPIAVGSVVVGRDGGGYLRQVTEVIDQGDRVVLRTVPADLSQAIQNGKASAQLHLGDELRSATSWDLGGRVLVDETLWSDAEGNYVDVSAFIAEGAHVTIDPVFDFDLELFNGNWIDAEFSSTVTMEYEADFIAIVSGSFDRALEGHVYTQEIPFAFEMGPVPVVGVATIELYAGFEADFAGAGNSTLHTEASAMGMLGAGYDGDWHGASDASLTGDLYLAESSWEQQFETRAWLRAEIEVELYSSAGAELVIEPWVEANSCGTTGVDVDGGVTGSHGYYFEAFGWSLSEWGPHPYATDSYDLFELECGA